MDLLEKRELLLKIKRQGFDVVSKSYNDQKNAFIQHLRHLEYQQFSFDNSNKLGSQLGSQLGSINQNSLNEIYETKRIIKSLERTEQLLIEIMEEENQSIYKKQKNTKNDPQRKAHLGHSILLIISPLIVFFILSISSYLHIPLILFFLGAILTIASLLLNWLNNR